MITDDEIITAYRENDQLLAEIRRLKALASDLNDDNTELRQTLIMENAGLKEKIERLQEALRGTL